MAGFSTSPHFLHWTARSYPQSGSCKRAWLITIRGYRVSGLSRILCERDVSTLVRLKKLIPPAIKTRLTRQLLILHNYRDRFKYSLFLLSSSHYTCYYSRFYLFTVVRAEYKGRIFQVGIEITKLLKTWFWKPMFLCILFHFLYRLLY